MGKWISDAYLDLMLDAVALANGESLCSQQATTYFNAVKGDLHTLNTSYIIGDIVRPGTPNGFVYECIADGTSGGTEPPWGTTQDGEFTDGTVQWKTHENYCLAYTDLAEGDITIDDNTTVGRKLTVAEKIGIVTHNAGTVSHTALIDSVNKVLSIVTTSETTLGENNDVVSGRTTILFAFSLFVNDPV